MKIAQAFLIGVAALLLTGCGGGGGSSPSARGEVSGIVFDENGVLVRDALVSYDSNHTVRSNSTGIYVLSDLPADYVNIQADLVQNGVHYVGENIANVSAGERTKDVNIALFPANQVASLHGVVTDRQGRLVSGVHIFLRPNAANTLLTSAVGITDGNGQFSIGSLKAGLSYHVQVNALGYDSDQEDITLSAGENRENNFVVTTAQVNNVPAPTNLAATAYTSPIPTRANPRLAGAVEMMKQRLNPRRKASTTRALSPGSQFEVDLVWDEISNTSLLGYGIYRGSDLNHLHNTDFLRDPQAQFFADIDDSLVEQMNYTYAITSLDTLFDGTQGESGYSNSVNVKPLGELDVASVNPTVNPTFAWNPSNGASSYVVYLYNQYPALGVTEIASNANNPTTSTTLTYDGGNLTRGQTYYAIIVGQNTTNTAYSISQVVTFTVQ